MDAQQELGRVGITCVGACADTVRNVTASPMAGVLDDEAFDVTPFAHAITQHFLFHQHNRKLPRKFKIALSGSDNDLAQVMINDVGLFARVSGSSRGFAIYVAGGLGSTPEIAHLWREFVPEADLLVACEAVLNVFFRDGERKNRKKARLKFLLRKVGEAEFLRRLTEEYDRLHASRGAELADALAGHLAGFVESAPPPPAAGGENIGDAAFARWKRTNTVSQKQDGYRAVTIKLPLGDVTSAQLRAIADACQRFGNGEVRATNTQNIVLQWVPEGRLFALHAALKNVALAEADADHITDIVSCPGGDYCTLAITRSMKLAADIRSYLEPAGSAGDSEDGAIDVVRSIGPLAIKVSGCPNSCGQHQVADIGMTGLMVKGSDGVERPHYSLRVGGAVGPAARIGDRLDGRVPEEETPQLLAAIARHFVAQRADGESFRDFAVRVGIEEITRVGFAAAPNAI